MQQHKFSVERMLLEARVKVGFMELITWLPTFAMECHPLLNPPL